MHGRSSGGQSRGLSRIFIALVLTAAAFPRAHWPVPFTLSWLMSRQGRGRNPQSVSHVPATNATAGNSTPRNGANLSISPRPLMINRMTGNSTSFNLFGGNSNGMIVNVNFVFYLRLCTSSCNSNAHFISSVIEAAVHDHRSLWSPTQNIFFMASNTSPPAPPAPPAQITPAAHANPALSTIAQVNTRVKTPELPEESE